MAQVAVAPQSRKLMNDSIAALGRKEFRKAIQACIYPFLERRGFSQIDARDKHISIDWHRPRPDGGYDLVSLVFPKRGGGAFSVCVQIAPKGGVTSIFGERIPAEKATAFSTNQWFFLFPSKSGLLSRLAQVFLNHCPFKLRVPRRKEDVPYCIEKVIQEFIDDFDQAETWWKIGTIGHSMKHFESTARAKHFAEYL